MAKQKITKPEICYECYYFREHNDGFLCCNPQSFWCDRQGIGKATRSCIHGKLNPVLITKYPESYGLQEME